MNKIPNGGFPPLTLNNEKKTLKKKDIKKERFYVNEKKININQILNINKKNIISINNNDLEEINTL